MKLYSNEKIAETSSKGNQEKWLDKDTNKWIKLDQFGYESLTESFISHLLEASNIEKETPFVFVRYDVEKVIAHDKERIACVSDNFLKPGQSIITLGHLLNRISDESLNQRLLKLTSNVKRIQYIAETTADFTGLSNFPKYLTTLFEIDALFLNDDRHLNNIAVLEENGKYSYCPIFDNGAGLLSNLQSYRVDIEPEAHIKSALSRPFDISFNRQLSAIHKLYGNSLKMPLINAQNIAETLSPLLDFYPSVLKSAIKDRVTECCLIRQKAFQKF